MGGGCWIYRTIPIIPSTLYPGLQGAGPSLSCELSHLGSHHHLEGGCGWHHHLKGGKLHARGQGIDVRAPRKQMKGLNWGLGPSESTSLGGPSTRG